MDSLKEKIASTSPLEGTIHTWWLGGAGFVFKTPAGTQLYIDPYLSNIVADIFGLERDFPPPVAIEDVEADIVLATHWHEDHLDPVALPSIAKLRDPQFVCPPSAASRLAGWGIPRARIQTLEVGQSFTFRDLHLTAVPARHLAGTPGWETPDAIGVIVEASGVRIYHTGDTEYDLRLRELKIARIDAAIAVINGTGGNMDAYEAALLVWQIGAGTVIPMHHRLIKGGWKGATLDPRLFEQTYRRLGGVGDVRILEVGEGTVLSRKDERSKS